MHATAHSALTTFAAEFACGTYGAGDYGSSQTCSQASGTQQASGQLPGTGVDALMSLYLGIALVVISVLLFAYNAYRRARGRKTATK